MTEHKKPAGSDKQQPAPEPKAAQPAHHAHSDVYDKPKPHAARHQEQHGGFDLTKAVEHAIHNPKATLKQAEHGLLGMVEKFKHAVHQPVRDTNHRITDVHTSGGKHIHLEYEGNGKQPNSFHVEGKQGVGLIARGEVGHNEKISVDQKSGVVTHKQELMQKGADGHAHKMHLEQRFYPDGSQVQITSDAGGHRLQKETIMQGKHGPELHTTQYVYSTKDGAPSDKAQVTAVQTDEKGRLSHRYEFENSKDVKAQKPEAREDVKYDDKPPALREHHKIYNVAHGHDRLVATNDKVVDLEHRITKFHSEKFDEHGKSVVRQDMQFDHDGKPVHFSYKDDTTGHDLNFKFKNGMPTDVEDAGKLVQGADKQRFMMFGMANLEATLPRVTKIDDATVAINMPNTSKKEGFNGVITNGADTYKVDGGNVYDVKGKLLAQMNADGRMHFAPGTGEQDKDASSFFKNGYQFIGNESGATRSFDIGNKTSNGEITLAGNGGPTRYEVHMGMIINPTTHEQIGKFVPPDDLKGELQGGYVEIGNPPRRTPLANFKGAQFSVQLTGETGETSRRIEGTALGGVMQADGTYKPGEGGLVNKNASKEDLTVGSDLERQRKALDRRPHILEDLPTDTSTLQGTLRMRNGANSAQVDTYEVRSGHIYKHGSNLVVGTIDSRDGSMSWTNDQGRVVKTTMNDAQFSGAVWHLEHGDGAAKQSVDWITTPGGKILSAAELRRGAEMETRYARSFNEESKSEESQRAFARGQELQGRFNKKLDDALQTGAVDADTLKYLDEGPHKNARAEMFREHTQQAAPERTIAVPTLADATAVAKTSGEMRHGNSNYDIDHGKIYRVHFDGQGHRVRDAKECGVLGTGYRVQIDGRVIDLNKENQTLLKLRVDGDAKEHRILGMGGTRTTADGRTVPGGLVEADELLRQARECKNQAQAGNQAYLNDMPILIGGTTDALMGGRADQMAQIQQTMDHQTNAMARNFDQMFNQGFSSNHLDNNQIDADTRAVQHFMRDMNLSTQDMTQMSEEGRQLQKQTADSAAMAVMTVATAGVGTAFTALANGGKLAYLAEASGLSARALMGGEIVVDSLVGGTSSVLLRTTQGADGKQVFDNFTSGMAEGGTVALSGIGGRAMQEAGLGWRGMLAGRVGMAGVNTVGFNFAGGIREGNLNDAMSARNLGYGMIFALAGDAMGTGVKGLKGAFGTESGLGKFLNADEMKIAFNAFESGSNGFTNSALAAVPQAMEMERQRIAHQLHISPDAVSEAMLNEHIDYKNVYNYVMESGLQGAGLTGLIAVGSHPMHSLESRAKSAAAPEPVAEKFTAGGEHETAAKHVDHGVAEEHAPAAKHVEHGVANEHAPAAKHVEHGVSNEHAPAAKHVEHGVADEHAPAAKHVEHTQAKEHAPTGRHVEQIVGKEPTSAHVEHLVKAQASAAKNVEHLQGDGHAPGAKGVESGRDRLERVASNSESGNQMHAVDNGDMFDILAKLHRQNQKFAEYEEKEGLNFREDVTLLDAEGNPVHRPNEHGESDERAQFTEHNGENEQREHNRYSNQAEVDRALRNQRRGGDGGTGIGGMTKLMVERGEMGHVDADGLWRAKRSLSEFTSEERLKLMQVADAKMAQPEHVEHFVDKVLDVEKHWTNLTSAAERLHELGERRSALIKDLQLELVESRLVRPGEFADAGTVRNVLAAHPEKAETLAKYNEYVKARDDYSVMIRDLTDKIKNERQPQLQKVVDEMTDRLRLPKVKLVLESDLRGANGSYRDGEIRLRAGDVLDPARVAKVVEVLYHELTHNRQDYEIVRSLLDDANIGTSISPEQLARIQEEYKHRATKDGDVTPSASYIEECIRQRNGERQSPSERDAADRYAANFKNYFSAGTVLSETANSGRSVSAAQEMVHADGNFEGGRGAGLKRFMSKIQADEQLRERVFGTRELPQNVKDMIAIWDVCKENPAARQRFMNERLERYRSMLDEHFQSRRDDLSAQREHAYAKYFTEIEQAALVSGQLAESCAFGRGANHYDAVRTPDVMMQTASTYRKGLESAEQVPLMRTPPAEYVEKPARIRANGETYVEYESGDTHVKLLEHYGWFKPLGHKEIPESDVASAKVHVTTADANDLRKVQQVLIPALVSDPVLKNLDLMWKTSNPMKGQAGGEVPYEGQNAKGFTIYFKDAQTALEAQKRIDQLFYENGLSLNKPHEAGNVDDTRGRSNRVGIVRDVFTPSVDSSRKSPAIVLDAALAERIERQYKLSEIPTVPELRMVELELGLKPEILFTDSQGKIAMHLKAVTERSHGYTKDGNYVSESGAGKAKGELTDRPALYAMYKRFGIDPLESLPGMPPIETQNLRAEKRSPRAKANGQTYDTGKVAIVGSGEHTQINVGGNGADGDISKRHAAIFTDANSNTYVADLGSKNGTFLNGYKIQPGGPGDWNWYPVRKTDRITLGVQAQMLTHDLDRSDFNDDEDE